MFKRMFSVLLAVSVLLPSAALYADALSFAKDGIEIYCSEPVSKNGEVINYRYVDRNGKEVKPVPSGNKSQNKAGAYPAKYDARSDGLVTPVKNQKPFGTCWAFAYCSAAETSLIKQGFETKSTANLSEAHLVWFTGESYSKNSSDPADGDGLNSDDIFDYGGNTTWCNSTVARWSGFAKEKDFKYNRKDVNKMKFDMSDKYVSDYQLVYSKSSVYLYSVNEVKNAIQRSGSVLCNIAYYEDYEKNSSKGFNYYCPDFWVTNHTVTIVGWDDGYSKNNFRYAPPKNGAWLCKNSWGSDWGNSGYFWLSYYDETFSEFTELRVVPSGSYVKNYQYDGFAAGALATVEGPTAYAANVFTSSGSESVSGAGFTSDWCNGYIASVSLYTGLEGDNPAGGTLRETKSVSCDYRGYYSVSFSKSYAVKKGEKFSIVVSFYSNADETYFSVEGTSGGGVTYSSKAGQSFISTDGKKWYDANKKGVNNVPIKAFTVSGKQVSSVSVNTMPQKTVYYAGSSFDPAGLSLRVQYSDGTSRIVSEGFSCTASDFTKVGTYSVAVNYGGKTAKLSVQVKAVPTDAVKSVSISDFSMNYRQEKALPVKVSAGSGADYTATYYSSDLDVAQIDGEGNIYAIGKGTAVVKCVVTDKYGITCEDTCKVTVGYSILQWIIIIFLFGWLWY